jgi:hypothetical protein
MVQTVVEAGADPLLRDEMGRCAWAFVIPTPKEEVYQILKYLLELGMPVNERLRDGTLPFASWFATPGVTPRILELFLDHGLDLTAQTRGRSLFAAAKDVAREELLAVLDRRADFEP